MTNSEVEQKAQDVLAQYLPKRGNAHKILPAIMEEEQIKFREIISSNQKFVGALTKANSGQWYIILNTIENTGRRNFTIAHELGHYFLEHQLQSNSFYCSDDAITEESQSANPIEQEANQFASCLLMPEEKLRNAFLAMLANSRKARVKDFLEVKNDYTFSIWRGICADLMKRYGVSEAALRYRLQGLGVASFHFKNSPE